ncbi:hypothetical protein EDEG_00989 [Edhazardia aedis USNM 41457]|uniref:Uncharacterized protein n=1 Tax=Edhazardia aedis (strain USNM 41457) TaxID=1003232 RepID=J9DBE6_EDHAE|nr:hypothetical protein EDEG_00989 [Edhazardia aedis USNM 41457]|eukprot:EJW04819.1 hypothetical protein EDEG_00989 [Edhazardia aedis USNM 41457]
MARSDLHILVDIATSRKSNSCSGIFYNIYITVTIFKAQTRTLPDILSFLTIYPLYIVPNVVLQYNTLCIGFFYTRAVHICLTKYFKYIYTPTCLVYTVLSHNFVGWYVVIIYT